MARALVINAEVRARINAAVEAARRSPITKEVIEKLSVPLTKRIALADRPAGFDRPPSQHVEIEHGYRASLSFEEQPCGLCRHLSVSVDNPGMLPNIASFDVIAKLFGMSRDDSLAIWMEEWRPGHDAINLVCLDKGGC